MRNYGLTISFLIVLATGLAIQSCIFQSDPLGPNEPPEITYFYPEWQIKTITAPSDSCKLKIRASDPERDAIKYSFVIAGPSGRVDSVLSRADTVVFHARREGLYTVQGRAGDSEGYSSRSWFIKVQDRNNVPPVITDYTPGSVLVQFGIGDTLYFDMEVDDDRPEYLVYRYFMGDSIIQDFGRKSGLTYRFLENGTYELTGMVWDGQFADSVTWHITISGEADTVPPAGVCDLEGRTGDQKGSVFLEWTAPGDDGYEGRAAGYQVRTSTIRITNEHEWKNSNSHPALPAVSSAGQRDSMVLSSLTPGEFVYICIRAYDDFYNLSPICSSPHVQIRGYDVTGVVIDTDTGDGVEGAMISAGGVTVLSNFDGGYQLSNLKLDVYTLFTRDETGTEIGDYHDYYTTASVLGGDIAGLDLYLVPNYPLISAEDDRYDDFMEFFRELTKTQVSKKSHVYRGWDHWPVKVYNPPEVHEGVDLQAGADSAMAEWEDYTGLNLFETVQSADEADAEIFYDYSVTEGKHYVDLVSLNEDGTPKMMRMIIYPLISTPAITAETHVIFTHEFGHIIGLDHSVDDGHIMIGLTFPRVDHVSEDEIHLVRSIYHLPSIFNVDKIKMD